MEGIMFDHLESLEKSRTNWRIKVRVTRMWSTISPEAGSVKGYNFIFLDDDNSHIHAYVYPDNWNSIGKNVVEGDVYIIENFQVRETIGRLRPVSTKLCIRLLATTTIEESEDDPMIPLHKFEFMDLGDLFEESNQYAADENPEFAIDLIGVIEDYEKLKKINTKFGLRDIVRFRLTDGSVSHKVSVWGDLAINMNDSYGQALEKPVIVIVTSTKLTIFKSSVQIGTLPSSKIYLNLNMEAVVDMRKRLMEEGYKSSESSFEITNVSNIRSPIDTQTFKDLNDNPSAFFAKKNVLVNFTIAKIEEEDNWWYHSCHRCHLEVEKIEKRFKCSSCKRSFGYAEKRFRILVLADDNTFASDVILTDRVVKRIIGTTATNLLNEIKNAESGNVIPDVLKNMVGKEIKVKIVLTEANISGDSNIYEATDLCDAATTSSNVVEYSPIPKCPSFNVSETHPGIELFETPGTSKSVSKKIKKEP